MYIVLIISILIILSLIYYYYCDHNITLDTVIKAQALAEYYSTRARDMYAMIR